MKATITLSLEAIQGTVALVVAVLLYTFGIDEAGVALQRIQAWKRY